jgi:hypothetical protein
LSDPKRRRVRSAVPTKTAPAVPLLTALEPPPSGPGIQPLPKPRRKLLSKTASNYLPPKKKRKRHVRRSFRKLHADSKIYKATMAIIAMKVQGKKYAEIAETLKLSEQTCKNYLYIAHKHNQINFDTFAMPEDALDIVLKSKAVRNINALLDDKDSCKGDKETTLEVAKGLGLLKQHQVVKGDTGPNLGIALQVQIQMPESGTALPQLRDGAVGGRPFTDADFALVPSE